MLFRFARGLSVTVVGLAIVAASTGLASADPAGNIEISGFRPAMDSRGYLTVNASQVLGNKEFSFGLGSLDWGYKLLTFQNGTNTYAVNNIITATLIGAFGIKAGPAELEFGVSAPLRIMNGDRGPDFTDPANHNNDEQFKIDGQGLGNIGFHFKTRFLKTSRP